MTKKRNASAWSVGDLVKSIEQFCRRSGLRQDEALRYLLDAMTDWFTYKVHVRRSDYQKYDKELRGLMLTFFQVMRSELEHKEWVDLFGDYFMEVAANIKGFGQCFTPNSICELLSRMCFIGSDVKNADKQLVGGFGWKVPIYDCAAGSSRLLLAAGTQYRQDTGRNDCYLCASDIDEKCVKMSAINMLIHGFYGEVVCQDTLMGEAGFRWGYIVNGALYPFHFGLPSLEFSTNRNDFYQLTHKENIKISADEKD